MNAVALKMLIGDRAKYFGLVFGIAFSCFLMSQQVSIFIGLMTRTASHILDVREADVWVMDPAVQYVDEVEPMPDIALTKVRSIDGVAWAAPLYKGLGIARVADGTLQQVILFGLDDASLAGAPPHMRYGRLEDIFLPDAMIMDRAGYEFIWPGEQVKLPRTLEINDHRMQVVAIADPAPTFLTFPITFVRYSEAMSVQPKQRKMLSFVLVKAADGITPEKLAERITAETGLQALTWYQFSWRSVNYYLQRTGVPVNFGITVALGFIVGAAVAGQTFLIFVLENMRQFGALKAIGVTNRQILSMVLVQALTVGAIGFGIGMGLCALFFEATANVTALRGFILPWQVVIGTGVAMLLIMLITTFVSIRRVIVIDPAIVFRG
jgi:putative ABC transport system permease protein